MKPIRAGSEAALCTLLFLFFVLLPPTITAQERNRTVKKVLRCQGNCQVKTDGRQVELSISRLEDFCAVHIRTNTQCSHYYR